MVHKDQYDLADELKDAERKVSVGAHYKHYKNPSRKYKVLQVAVLEASDEVCVIYQAKYGKSITFVRPLESWLQTVK